MSKFGAASVKNHWKKLVVTGIGLNCSICEIPFTANAEITLDHIKPRSLDGAHKKKKRIGSQLTISVIKLKALIIQAVIRHSGYHSG